MNTDISFLSLVDVFDNYRLIMKKVSDGMECEELDMKIPIVRKYGRIFLRWWKYDKILDMRNEFVNLLPNVSHPSLSSLHI